MKDNARGLVSVLDRKQLRGGRDSGLQNEGIKSIIGGKAMGAGCARMATVCADILSLHIYGGTGNRGQGVGPLPVTHFLQQGSASQ